MTEALQTELQLPPCDQVGFVVSDLDAAMAHYAPLFGPFQTMDPGPMSYNYRGREETCDMKLAFARSGELEIELIQWVSGGCPHKEFLDAGREGMHHLRFPVEDLEPAVAAAAEAGFLPIWQKRYAPGLAVAYLEREGDPLLVELFENQHA